VRDKKRGGGLWGVKVKRKGKFRNAFFGGSRVERKEGAEKSKNDSVSEK